MEMAPGSNTLPLWDLNPVYKGFDDDNYKNSKKKLIALIEEVQIIIDDGKKRKSDPETWLEEFINKYNEVGDLYENLGSYAYTRYSTDTRDATALKELGFLEEKAVPLETALVNFRNNLADLKDDKRDRRVMETLISGSETLKKVEFFLREQLLLQEKQMTPAEENLAADLSRSGGDAWGRMHSTISSTASILWDEQTGERKTVTQLRNLAHDADRSVREKAFKKELEAWKQVEIPLSYALNGVKGFSVTLNKRRHYENSLHRSIIQSRISKKTLESLIQVMDGSLPLFHRYLKAKAKALGLNKLAFYDLFAPVGASTKTWNFDDAEDFIVKLFTGFTPELGDFARNAFTNRWIDARPRDGKVGGAYCISFPLTGESRILCNFGGSFSDVTTVAHELGHGYHHHVLKEDIHIHRDYPMTLAETASIFAESIVFDGAISQTEEKEQMNIIEAFLQDTTQVIVDILSRFKFEEKVFENRRKGELSPEEFSGLMIEAQKATYGDTLDPELLHPYMWAVKGHYYSQNLAFYNFPYAFGLLFGLGLYALYRKEGPSFAKQYRNILKMTGRESAITITGGAGFDIEKPDFWQAGIDMIGERVDEFENLVAKFKER